MSDEITQEQWDNAKARFDTMLGYYTELIGVPGVNPNFAIMSVFDPLLRRYNSGERSQELYDEMLEVE